MITLAFCVAIVLTAATPIVASVVAARKGADVVEVVVTASLVSFVMMFVEITGLVALS